MRYINTKTGAVIDSSFVISGGDWVKEVKKVEIQEVIDPPKAAETPQDELEEPSKQEEVAEPATNPTGANDAYDSITVPQIKQELDAFGVEYDKRANKRALYDLMMSQGK